MSGYGPETDNDGEPEGFLVLVVFFIFAGIALWLA